MAKPRRRNFVGVFGNYMKPTLNHRPAIWEMMLGTVHAMNDKGESKYFDYDYEAAKKFANVENKKDIRIFKCDGGRRVEDCFAGSIRDKQMVLWVEKNTKEVK